MKTWPMRLTSRAWARRGTLSVLSPPSGIALEYVADSHGTASQFVSDAVSQTGRVRGQSGCELPCTEVNVLGLIGEERPYDH